jgi:hypothetical protein
LHLDIDLDDVADYISRGKTAVKNPSRSLLYLEDLIKGYHKSEIYSKLLSSTEEYKNVGPKKEFFIALALPSMTGKTQMAFNIRSKRPLYFALQTSQMVNRFFSLISTKFMNMLESDFDEARKKVKSKIISKGSLESEVEIETFKNKATEIITLDFLYDYLSDHKFESLGFILSLIKECENRYTESTNDEWMKFYAENQILLPFLKYDPISLAELVAQNDVYTSLSEKYFFFIDEFNLKSGVIMFRNICRYLRIPCVLASTNSKIVNLIGISTSSGSGSTPPSVFCAAFPKLSTLSHEEIEQFFNEEIKSERFLELACNVSENEERRMSLLLQFFKDQAKKTRPGVSLYLFEALMEVSKSLSGLETLKVDTVFQKVIKLMINSIDFRKNITFSTIEGMQANVDLLGGKEFDSKYIPLDSPKNDDSSLIDNHFFYLKNPRSQPNLDEPFLLFNKNIQGPMVVSCPLSKTSFSTQGFFDENEELLKLVCLLAEMHNSSYRIIFNPKGRKHSTADLGKELEVVTYAAFLESSHFNDEKSVLLEGVSIKGFLKNLLANLYKESKNIRSSRKYVKLDYKNVEDDQILAETVVPCLYIVNHDWPAEIKAIFDPKESSFKLGKYTRTPNSSEIDATIDLIDKDGRNRIGVIECKNREAPVSSSDYAIIIEKAIKYSKIKKIENFLNNLRPIVKPDIIESFEKFIKSDLNDPNFAAENEDKSRRSFKALIENFEDLSKFQAVRSKLKNFVKEENLNEFELLLKDLDGLKSACPLVHFLICKSCKSLKSLRKGFPDRKINFFRFVKDEQEYKIMKATDPIHKDPEMVALIIETDIVNDIKK